MELGETVQAVVEQALAYLMTAAEIEKLSLTMLGVT